jgi:hypothetical protein
MLKIKPAPLALILAMSFMFSPLLAATKLTKEQIASQIIGKTLNAKRMGIPVRILYAKDGKVQMKFPIFSGHGTWKYNGDGVCMNIVKGPRKGETCVTFEKIGENRYRNSEGIEFTIGQDAKK